MAFFNSSKWPLQRRLSWLRVVQYLIALVNLITMSYLAGDLNDNHTGATGSTIVPIIMAALTFSVTVLGNWLGVHVSGYERRGCLGLFIAFDIVCVGLQIPSIAVLAVAGLPSKCPIRNNSYPQASGFGGDNDGKRCGIPKASFCLSIILLVLYVYSIGLIIRQMIALGRQRKASRNTERERTVATHHVAQSQRYESSERQSQLEYTQSPPSMSVAARAEETPPPYQDPVKPGTVSSGKKH